MAETTADNDTPAARLRGRSPASAGRRPEELRLPDDVKTLQRMVLDLMDQVRKLDRDNQKLRHQLHLHLRHRFGPRSEKLSPDQMLLFEQDDGDTPEASSEEDPEAEAQDERPAPRRENKGRRNGRRPLPGHLPRTRQVHDVDDGQPVCPCCDKPMVKIGEDTGEQLEYKPASFYVIVHVYPKYACKDCEDGVLTAAKPAGPIPRGLPGPGLLANAVVDKYADHLPLYRQEKRYARHGVDIARSTLCDWVAAAAKLAEPVWQAMKQEILAGRKIHTDDTKVPVLDKDRTSTREGRAWVYVGDDEHPQIVYDYTPDRRKERPAEFLEGFEGYLQADAYGGYDSIYAGEKVIEVACLAHARRKFYDARLSDRHRAHVAIAMIREIYDVEDAARGRPPDERKRIRDAQAPEILDRFKQWLDDEKPQVLPKSPMGEAIGYALNQWEALCRYLDDGILEVDNNAAERSMRPLAVGRKNWMFAGSDAGGRRAAILYSLVETCKAHRVDPFEYLRDLFDRLPGHPADRIAELTPPAWKAAREDADTSTDDD